MLLPLPARRRPEDAATVLAIADELTEDGLVLRYRVEETDDGLHGEEGAFVICSFWLVSALVEIGEITRARQLCERLLSFASPLNLYAEEIQPRTGQHLGNFPQAFTHLALINAGCTSSGPKKHQMKPESSTPPPHPDLDDSSPPPHRPPSALQTTE